MIHLIVAREKNKKKNELLNELRAYFPCLLEFPWLKKKLQLSFQVYRQALHGVPAIIRISNEVQVRV